MHCTQAEQIAFEATLHMKDVNCLHDGQDTGCRFWWEDAKYLKLPLSILNLVTVICRRQSKNTKNTITNAH